MPSVAFLPRHHHRRCLPVPSRGLGFSRPPPPPNKHGRTVMVYERIHASPALGDMQEGGAGGVGRGGRKPSPSFSTSPSHRRLVRRRAAHSSSTRDCSSSRPRMLCVILRCVTSTETALPSLAHLPQNEKLWIALGEFPNPTGTQVPDSRNPQRCNPCTHSELFDGDHAKSVNDRAVLHLEISRGLCR